MELPSSISPFIPTYENEIKYFNNMLSKEDEYILAKNIKEKYSYFNIIFNEEIPYTLYREKDIGEICKIVSIRSITRNYNKYEKIKINSKSNGGNQNINYLTYNGLLKLLVKSRKHEVLDFIKLFNINIKTTHYTCIESDTIKCILDTFNGQNMISQFKVNNYFIDLYFSDYNLAIECDENHSDIEEDLIRQIYIEKKLNCKFIRYKPYEKNFNIYNLFNKIYKFIYNFNLEKNKNEINNNKILVKKNEDLINENISINNIIEEYKKIIDKQALEIEALKEIIENQNKIVEIIKNENESVYKNIILPDDDLTPKFNEFIDKMCIIRNDVEELSTNIDGQFRIWCQTKPKKEIFHAFKNYLDIRFKPSRISPQNQTKNQVVYGYIGVKLKEIEYKKQFINNDVETFIFQVCKFLPNGKVLNSTLLNEYQKWKKSLNKESNENDIKEIKTYLNSCIHVIKATVWTNNGSNEGYYGISLKSEEYKYKNTSSTGKIIYKIEISTKQIIGVWETIAKAVIYEDISAAKMSRSVKNKIIFNNDYYYSTEKPIQDGIINSLDTLLTFDKSSIVEEYNSI